VGFRSESQIVGRVSTKSFCGWYVEVFRGLVNGGQLQFTAKVPNTAAILRSELGWASGLLLASLSRKLSVYIYNFFINYFFYLQILFYFKVFYKKY
jgi:hypothetical protein